MLVCASTSTLAALAVGAPAPDFATEAAPGEVAFKFSLAETWKKFSVEACRDKFAVAADNGARIMKQYDAALWMKPARQSALGIFEHES